MTSATTDVRAPGITGVLAPIGLVVAGLIIFAGNYDVRKNENGGTGPAIVTAVICVVLAAVLFGYVVPRVRNANRTALILAAIGVVSIVAFWSGIPPVLTAASLAVAPPSAASPRSTKIVQALAAVVSAVALVGTLAQSHLF